MGVNNGWLTDFSSLYLSGRVGHRHYWSVHWLLFMDIPRARTQSRWLHNPGRSVLGNCTAYTTPERVGRPQNGSAIRAFPTNGRRPLADVFWP